MSAPSSATFEHAKAAMTSVLPTKPCPLCGEDHLTDLVLAHLHTLTPKQLIEMYANTLQQMLLSARDDVTNKGQASYLSRIRTMMESYMKGVWVGLLATPDEIVHDASGKKPRNLMLANLSEKVGLDVLGIKLNLYQPAKTPKGAEFTPMHFLNTATHMTAYFIAFAFYLSHAQVQKAYSDNDKLMEAQLRTLLKIDQRLKEGKTRDEIIVEIRKTTPSKSSP